MGGYPDSPCHAEAGTLTPREESIETLLTVYLVRFADNHNFHHWALWFGYPRTVGDCNKKHFLCRAKGCQGAYRYECEACEVLDFDTFTDATVIGWVSERNSHKLRAIAASTPIQNDVREWNEQTFVCDVLDSVDRQGLFDWEDGVCPSKLRNLMDDHNVEE